MESLEFKVDGSDYLFRIAKMNAIEVLGLRTLINYEDIDKAITWYKALLERVEVNFGSQWLPVKEKNREVYYPAGIEDNYQLISGICAHFMNDFLKPVFWSSNESKA